MSKSSDKTSEHIQCVNQNDCQVGFICTSDHICKAGLGTVCYVDDDCASNFQCHNQLCIRPPNLPSTMQNNPSSVNNYIPIQNNSSSVNNYPSLENNPLPINNYHPMQNNPLPINNYHPMQNNPLPINNYHPMQNNILSVNNYSPMQNNLSSVNNYSPMQNNLSSVNNYSPMQNNSSPINNPLAVNNHSSIQNNSSSVNNYSNSSPVNNGERRLTISDIFNNNAARSVTSTDNEINSGDEQSVSSPCTVIEGNYYCRGNNSTSSSVIDICSYSTATLFLLEDSNITREINNVKERITNNVTLRRITSYNGYIYGIGIDGKLYTLPNDIYNNSNWVWVCCSWAPSNILHFSSTHDSKHLWIQTPNKGYLYAEDNKLLQEVDYTEYTKRVYGKDITIYIDIDQRTNNAMMYPSGKSLNDVFDAVISYHGDVVSIHPKDKYKFRGITIVNWFPYYINV